MTLGCSFIFMRIINRVGFMLLGPKTFECASEDLPAYPTEQRDESVLTSVSGWDPGICYKQ